MKKFNNDEGKAQLRNHAKMLTTLGKCWIDNLLKEQYFIVDLLNNDMNESSFIDRWHSSNDIPSSNYHKILSRSTIVKLNRYLVDNQRFKKDKSSRQINMTIMPMENESDTWSEGWFVNVNVRELLHQLCSISFRVNNGSNFGQHHRNKLSHNELFEIFDWTVYSEEQSQIISVSIREWELNKNHRQTCEDSSQARITLLNPNNGTITMVREEMKYAIEKCMPLKETPRLDLYFDNSELTTLSLLSCACIEFICKSNEEYCILKFIPHERRQPSPPEENDKESSKMKKRKIDH